MKITFAFLALSCAALTLQAQVPTPAAFLGYELGDRFTRHHSVVDYAKALAEVSDRAVWQPYGRTSEFRELGLLVVTSEANQSRLETLRAENIARTEGGGRASGRRGRGLRVPQLQRPRQ